MIDDIDLVDAVKAGDLSAWDPLWELHRRTILGYLYNRVRDIHTAEDLTSEVLVKAMRNIHRYERRKGVNFGAWINVIAHSVYVDWVKVCTRNSAVCMPHEHLDMIDPDRSTDPEVMAQRSEWFTAFNELLNRLTPEQQEVLAVHISGERSSEGIAAITGQTPRAAKTMKYRAIQALLRQPEMRVLAPHATSPRAKMAPLSTGPEEQ